MTTPVQDPTGAPVARPRWQRLCARLGRWCDFLLDTHHSRIPF